MKSTNIIGVIFPLPRHIIYRFLNEKKYIFVKYIPRIPTKKSKFKIVPGLKLYFYESASRKAIVVEAIIKSIEFLTIDETIDRYNEKLMISENELIEYANGRTKKIMALKIEDIKKLDPLIQIKGSINLAGRYVTKENIEEIFDINDLDSLGISL